MLSFDIFDPCDPCERFILFGGFYFGKIWKSLEKRSFFGQIWPDWGNTAQADMARLGSIGLNEMEAIILVSCGRTRTNEQSLMRTRTPSPHCCRKSSSEPGARQSQTEPQ